MSLLLFCGAGPTSRSCRCSVHVQWRGRAVCICTVLLAVGSDGQCGMDGTCWNEVAISGRTLFDRHVPEAGGGGAVAVGPRKLARDLAESRHSVGIHSRPRVL